jgi:recombinational DNA repair protein (RecF pathway)
MTLRAVEQGCPLDFASCYFEVWMLRLAGVLPDLFVCSTCATTIPPDAQRFLATGLQKTLCALCDSGANPSVQANLPHLLYWILKNKLDPVPPPSALAEFDRAIKNLHELNQFWIRHYSDR